MEAPLSIAPRGPAPPFGRGRGGVAYDVADETLRGLLDGLLAADWHSVCLFTGRYQWRGYDEAVGRDTASTSTCRADGAADDYDDGQPQPPEKAAAAGQNQACSVKWAATPRALNC